MASAVLALYEDRATALLAARDLTDHGFDAGEINILSGGPGAADWAKLDPTEQQKRVVAEGAGVGAAIGAAGGVLITLATLPGVGPLIAAGPLFLGLFSGGAVGAIAGALIGGLVDMGIPEHHAHAFLQGVRNGGTLIALHAPDDDRARLAASVLKRRAPMDIKRETDSAGASEPGETELDGGVMIVHSVTIRLPDSLGSGGDQVGLR